MLHLSDAYERRLDDLVDEIFDLAYTRYTWPELARAAGLSPSTVANLGKRKTRLPQLRTVFMLAQALGMDIGLVRTKLHRKAA